MNVYFALEDFRDTLPHPVVTLGNFDGVHVGHGQIFAALRKQASACRGTSVVLTFFPHPLKVLCRERAPRLICSLDERIELIEACGVDVVLCIPFTRAFAAWSPERFVQEILVERIAAREVLVGEDFRFGKDRAGDLELLESMGRESGFALRRFPPVRVHGREASSTRIRYSIQKGLIREATLLLGRPYAITGLVVEGDRRGRELGFPTANLETQAELLPPDGVYAVRARLDGETAPGVANLGKKPTFSGSRFSVEIHLFDFDGDLYDRTLRVELVEWIRQERTFPGPEALVEQIRRDAQAARHILASEPT